MSSKSRRGVFCGMLSGVTREEACGDVLGAVDEFWVFIETRSVPTLDADLERREERGELELPS